MIPISQIKGLSSRFWLTGDIFLLCFVTASPTLAQIVPDATLPVNSTVTPQGNTLTIEGGTTAGGNLFHSFREFSVPTGAEAFFNNAVEIQNIFTRVTGGNISNIDGLIRANGVANLFLINPNGIIFGPNAKLNIGGSFFGSTASGIRFADGTFFGTTNPQSAPLLTISVPVGLQMGPHPGNIVVQGSGNNLSISPIFSTIRDNRPVGLQVAPGQTLALLGGNLALEGGNLTAESGRIELGSVGGETLVTLTPMNQGMALSYPGIENFQDISFSRAASVDASGAGGGDVFVAGRRVTLTDGSVILALTEGAKPGGIVSVRASEVVEAIGTAPDNRFPSGMFTEVQPEATGDGGNLKIETTNLRLVNGGQLAANTFGAGKAGNLTLKATDTVELIGKGGQILSSLAAATQELTTGDAGNIKIETARLRVADGAQVTIETLGSGKAGNLTVKATDTVELLNFANLRAYGLNAGNITIETAHLQLHRAEITLSLIRVGEAGVSGRERSGGDIKIKTGLLQLRQGSRIATDAIGIGAGTESKGGNIAIDAKIVAALENSDISANSDNFFGGRVIIAAQGIFGTQFRDAITSESDITASGKDAAFSGTVTINTPAIDPSSGLIELPQNFVNITGLIANQCYSVRQGSSFTVTGRGGLPASPDDLQTAPTTSPGWVTRTLGNINRADIGDQPAGEQVGRDETNNLSLASEATPDVELVEATGWLVNEKGQVVLTASAPNVTPTSPWLTPPTCPPSFR